MTFIKWKTYLITQWLSCAIIHRCSLNLNMAAAVNYRFMSLNQQRAAVFLKDHYTRQNSKDSYFIFECHWPHWANIDCRCIYANLELKSGFFRFWVFSAIDTSLRTLLFSRWVQISDRIDFCEGITEGSERIIWNRNPNSDAILFSFHSGVIWTGCNVMLFSGYNEFSPLNKNSGKEFLNHLLTR